MLFSSFKTHFKLKNMKKLRLIAVLVLIIPIIGYSQTSNSLREKMNKQEIPYLVKISVERDYPMVVEEEWMIVSERAFKNNYIMADENTLIRGESSFYQLKMVENETQGYLVYDVMGNLLHSRLVMVESNLPRPIMMAITKKYIGWKITSDREVIKTPNEIPQTYSVNIVKGDEKRRLLISGEGKIIKDLKGS